MKWINRKRESGLIYGKFNKPYVFKILINSSSRFDYQRLTKQDVYIQTRTCVFSPKECLLSLRFGICISNNKRCSSLSIFTFYIMVGWRWNQWETLGVRIFFHSSLRPSHFVITVKKIQFKCCKLLSGIIQHHKRMCHSHSKAKVTLRGKRSNL